jgi:MFS family permease
MQKIHKHEDFGILYYYLSAFFCNLIFIIPIWVTFERRILSFSQMALLEVIGSTIIIIMQLPTGAIADLIGRKKTVVIGLFINGIGYVMFTYCQNFTQFIVAYLVINLGLTFVSGADTALLYDNLKHHNRMNDFNRIYSKKNFIIQIAIVIGTICGGYLYISDFRLPYILYAFLIIVSGILYVGVKETSFKRHPINIQSYIHKNVIGFKELFKTPHLKKLSTFYIIVGGLTWSSQMFLNQIFASDIGLSDIDKSWFFAILRIVNSILLFIIATNKHLMTKKRSYIFFPLFMLIAFLPGMFATKITGMVMVWIAVFLGTSRFTILDKFMNDEFDSNHRATALSALSMFVNMIYIGMMIVSGYVIDAFSVKTVYTILGILTIIFVIPISYLLYSEKTKNVVQT